MEDQRGRTAVVVEERDVPPNVVPPRLSAVLWRLVQTKRASVVANLLIGMKDSLQKIDNAD